MSEQVGQEQGIRGNLDGVTTGGVIQGWALRADGGVALVRLTIDGKDLAAVEASLCRADLQQLGLPCCAFSTDVPISFLDGEEHVLAGWVEGEPLARSPVLFRLDRATALAGVGFLDGIDLSGRAGGWARFVNRQGKARLLIEIDGEPVDEVVADSWRDDLSAAGHEPESAFWYKIPERFRDGERHSLAIQLLDAGAPLDGSPLRFMLGTGAGLTRTVIENLVSCPEFDSWPSGLVCIPDRDQWEPVTGWLFRCDRGVIPATTIRAERPAGLGLVTGTYAMAIDVEAGTGSHGRRLIVPLEGGLDEVAQCTFSLGVQRPIDAGAEDLHIAEVRLAWFARGDLIPIGVIHGPIRPRGPRRIGGVSITPGVTTEPPENESAHLALVIELAGTGQMLLYQPCLSAMNGPTRTFPAIDGMFEDERIRDQLSRLVLPPIWTASHPVVTTRGTPEPSPEPRSRVTRTGLPFVQIVVAVYNAAADVEAMIASVLTHTEAPFELLIRDDASGGFTKARLARWEALDPRVRVHTSPDNVGYTRTINIAIAECVAEHVVILNSDTIVTEGWLTRLLAVILADEKVGGVGPLSNAASWQSIPRTRDESGNWLVNTLPTGWTVSRVASIVAREAKGGVVVADFPILNGFCTLFRRSALLDIGLFDDVSFPRGYGEENDLCLRLTQAGWSLKVATDVYVFHRKSMSFGAEQRRKLSQQAGLVLRAKHPKVRFDLLEEQMRNSPAIGRVREALLAAIASEQVG